MQTLILITPSVAQFVLNDEEIRRALYGPVDGKYGIVNPALHRSIVVMPDNPLTEDRLAWLLGER